MITQIEPTSNDSSKRQPNFAAMTRMLRRRFQGTRPRGYVRGKTQIRDALMGLFSMSAFRAERLVDQMQALGYVRYRGNPQRLDSGRQPWMFDSEPLAAA